MKNSIKNSIKNLIKKIQLKTSISTFIFNLVCIVGIFWLSSLFNLEERGLIFQIFRIILIMMLWRFSVKFIETFLMKTKFNNPWLDIPELLKTHSREDVELMVLQDNARQEKRVKLEQVINIGSALIIWGMWSTGIL